MVFFNSETEDICKELGYDLILPAASLRQHLDSKIVTTQLGNEAGAPSVPNVLTRVDDWAGLLKVAEKARLGDELVVQTPYGDSGKTTFFISSEADWSKHSADIVGEEIKVMRRINNRPVAVEAVLTRCGTIVGPFMSELIGYKRLTPSRGGWCGNEMFPEVLTGESRRTATQLVRRLGDRLAKEGYRGFFEVDVLVDTDTTRGVPRRAQPADQRGLVDHERHRGRLRRRAAVLVPHPRVHERRFRPRRRRDQRALGGAGVRRRVEPDGDEGDRRHRATAHGHAPHRAVLARRQRRAGVPQARLDWHQLQNEREAFFLRIYGPGDYRWKGADLGVLVTKGRLQVDNGQGKSSLAIRARHLIDSIRAEYAGTPITEPATPRTNVGVKSG